MFSRFSAYSEMNTKQKLRFYFRTVLATKDAINSIKAILMI